MAQVLQPSSLLSPKSRHRFLLPSPTIKPTLRQPIIIKSLDSSSSSKSSEPTTESSGYEKPTSSQGQGFGSPSASAPSKSKPSGKREKGRREKASVIRRAPIEKPQFAAVSQEEEAKVKEQTKNESAFLLAWLGLAGVILVEGIALAASGFLPEEWDKFFVKYLYPTFTPTVLLFIAGTTGYGILKYLQNEKIKNRS